MSWNRPRWHLFHTDRQADIPGDTPVPEKNRKASSSQPKATNLAGLYGKIGIRAVEAAAQYDIRKDRSAQDNL